MKAQERLNAYTLFAEGTDLLRRTARADMASAQDQLSLPLGPPTPRPTERELAMATPPAPSPVELQSADLDAAVRLLDYVPGYGH